MVTLLLVTVGVVAWQLFPGHPATFPAPPSPPQIRITEIPRSFVGSPSDLVDIAFQVTGRIPDGSRVFIYSLTDVWHGQPNSYEPITIGEAGQRSLRIHPGTAYAAILATRDFGPPDKNPGVPIPPDMKGVLAEDVEKGVQLTAATR
jgi:hypothetical protein